MYAGILVRMFDKQIFLLYSSTARSCQNHPPPPPPHKQILIRGYSHRLQRRPGYYLYQLGAGIQ